MKSIQVCFVLHDKYGSYSKYLGIAIMSLFECTDSKVHAHILCDDTVSEENKKRFKILAAQYGQKITFYQIDTSELIPFEKRVNSLSIGTLFRLKILDTLSEKLDRIIYLDDDLLINMDVHELWELNLTDYALAACRDVGIKSMIKKPYPCEAGWVSVEDYFNAGVMVLNLIELRKNEDFAGMCIRFLKENPECIFFDQDVFNFFFKGRVYYLPEYCNLLSKPLRQKEDAPLCGICHMAGDYVDPGQSFWFDRLFFEYWERSPWNVSSEILPYFFARERRYVKQILFLQKILAVRINGRRPFVIWGASSVLQEKLQAVYPELATPDWYVDSNINLQGKMSNDKMIRSPESLKNYDVITKPFVLVMSKSYYDDISSKLMEYGYQESSDYGDATLLLLQSQGGVFSEHGL